jgi:protease-4
MFRRQLPYNPRMPTIDADLLVDRRRLKRQLSFWRVATIVAALGIIAVAVGRSGALFGESHVARLTVSGIIVDDPERNRALEEVARNRRARALVLRIDSPGGTVVGGESLFRQVRMVAERKPVVAVLGEVAASGGYMVALAADHVIAREGTITGSIGVIMQTADVTGLLGKLGITMEAIKSAPLKAVPSPLEPLTEEGRAATRSLIEDTYEMFVGMVAERRKLEPGRARELADGRVYTGRQALSRGLIDAIGGETEARSWLEEHGIDHHLRIKDVQIEREGELWRDLISTTLSLITGKTYLKERLTLDGLVALWHPDVRGR